MGFSTTIADNTGVPVLFSKLYVGGWIIHSLSDMEFINYMTWIWEGPMPRLNPDGWMFEISRYYKKYVGPMSMA